MLRRLFFLFPDEKYAKSVVDQLLEIDISKRRIHAMSLDKNLNTLPQATERQRNDTAFRAQSVLWNVNLLLFAFSAIAFLVTLIAGDLFWIIVALAIMIMTFIVGEQFVVHVPDVHTTEFTDALSHGEILLMIDVPVSSVAGVENFVHRRHPEASAGVVGWSVDAFGM